MRLAFIVSHPIQYYVPVYRGLAERIRQADERLKDEETKSETTKERQTDDGQPSPVQREETGRRSDQPILTTDDSARISAVKVFYTWRDAGVARDVRFGKEFAWDIPLMEGYDFEVVPNTSSEPGTHHRQGLINPALVARVKAWKPDAVVITGYNYVSHGQAIKELSKAGIPVIFRGDSHLLDDRGPWWKWWIKKSWLSKVYRWPQGFAYVGQANRDYYRAFGVPERKLFPVPHTIDVGRFAEPHEELEAKALAWRRELGIPDDHFVFLYAAKLEPRKRPMELLEAFLAADMERATLLFVGSGELEEALRAKAAEFSHGLRGLNTDKSERLRRSDCGGMLRAGDPGTRKSPSEKTDDGELPTENSGHRVIFVPFQNQSAMPVVYRLGDALVLPSGYGETWGLAVNEAQACGRPSLVSDCVGCARDIVREGENGAVFRTDDWEDCVVKMKRMVDEWRKESKGPKDQETKRPKDEKASVERKREVIRAGAWGFDTARGVDALLAELRKCLATAESARRREA
jgi:glycosyltransferase involved in cell wall biosynthesis